MGNVVDLTIALSQAGMWEIEETSRDDFGQYEPLITFTCEVLHDYLKSIPLVSFSLICQDGIEKFVAIMTKTGRALKPLSSSPTLRHFSIRNMAVKKFEYLPFNKKLKSMILRDIKVAKWDGPKGWNAEATDDFVSRAAIMHELENLDLGYIPLTDQHLETLLPNLISLRDLEISGKLMLPDDSETSKELVDTNHTSPSVGCITDRGCCTVARILPNLQSLSFAGQASITARGLDHIIRSCSHLRSIAIQDAQIRAADLPSLLVGSRSLLIFGATFQTDGGRNVEKHHKKVATKATGGRTLVASSSGDGLRRPPAGLSKHQKKQWEHSKKLTEERFRNVNYLSPWAPLWGVDVNLAQNG